MTDNKGVTGQSSKTVIVTAPLVPNAAPIPQFTFSGKGVSPLAISVDASTSSDPDGVISDYQWTVSDGKTATGRITEFNFTIAKEYVVTLTVVDNKGATAILSKSITIPIVPTAKFTLSTTEGVSPLTVYADASASSDIDGNIVSYQWGTSDGQTANGKVTTFNFTKTGDYKITLTTTDNDGHSTRTTQSLSVKDTIVKSCTATFSFETGKLNIPCITAPDIFGVKRIYSVELIQPSPFVWSFEVNPSGIKQHDFSDDCVANYESGIASVPCISVGDKSYHVDFQQQENSLVFNIISVH